METTIPKLHPFEKAGMGTGPYRYLGEWSFPSKGLAEHNPTAYHNALQSMPKLSGGCGSCRNCGRAINLVCIVADAQGIRYGVGSDCVEKTGDASLGNKAFVAAANHSREMRRQRAEMKADARRRQYQIDHADEIAANKKANDEAREKKAAYLAGHLARVQDSIDILKLASPGNNFYQSLLSQLLCYGSLSERQAEHVTKLQFGRFTDTNAPAFYSTIEKLTTRLPSFL